MYEERPESLRFKIVKNTLVILAAGAILAYGFTKDGAAESEVEVVESVTDTITQISCDTTPKEKAAATQIYPCDIEKLCAFELEMRMDYFASCESETAFATMQNTLKPQTETITYSEYVTQTAEEFGITEMEVEILTKVAWLEAGICTLEGQAAVVSVVLNRVESENVNFPDSIYEVVTQKGQFNPAYAHWPFIQEPTTQTQQAVRLALSGIDYSNGACFYYNPDFSDEESCKWFDTLETATEYDGHIFKYDVI